MTSWRDTANLLLELNDGWLTIRLNRPETRNSLSAAMTAELAVVALAVRDDHSVRGITLRGNGGTFCAGADLKGLAALQQRGETDSAAVEAFSRNGGELYHLINELPQTVLVLVEGAAIGGGLGLACAADVVVVTKDAKFALTETTLGVAPAQIAPLVVQRIGLAAARRIMLTAARFDGTQAHALGLADFVVENAAGFDAVEATVKAGVLASAPGANAITKEIVLATRAFSGSALIDFAAQGFARAVLSDEGGEGIAAFLEKRKPRWTR